MHSKANTQAEFDAAVGETVRFLRHRIDIPWRAVLDTILSHEYTAELVHLVKNDRAAYGMLHEKAVEIAAAGGNVPEPLRPILTGELARPSSRGPHPRTNATRDMFIVLALERLRPKWPIVQGWPTGPREAPKSPYKIVQAALAELGVNITVDAIRKADRNFKKSPPFKT